MASFGLTCVQISRMKQETHLRRGTSQRLSPRACKVIWFQHGSNEGPLNRRFFGISGADSTVLRFVNSRMVYRCATGEHPHSVIVAAGFQATALIHLQEGAPFSSHRGANQNSQEDR